MENHINEYQPVSLCIYAIRYIDTGKKCVVNVDRLMPCEQLNADQFPQSNAAKPNDALYLIMITQDMTTTQTRTNWWPIGTRTEGDDTTCTDQQTEDAAAVR